MSAAPQPPAACYGLACPYRRSCALFTALGVDDGHVIDSCQTAYGWPLYRMQSARSELLRKAGFVARDKRLTCDECGGLFTAQMLPIHRCVPGETMGGLDP